MNHYFLKKECKELHAFPHIVEFAFKKISTIQFDSLKKETLPILRFYYVVDGRFDWMIEDHHHILYPGDLAIILPGQCFGGQKDLLDIGTVSWLHLEFHNLEQTGKLKLGKWSRLADSDCLSIGKILLFNQSPVLSKLKEAGTLFQTISHEFLNQEIGYTARINQLLDELFIL
ncbi:MAG: AraC family transcriptional regulator, partial [Chitinophagaceae bacterium]